MAFTKLQGVTTETIGTVLRGFDASDWRDLDAFLVELAGLPYAEQTARLGVDHAGVSDVETGSHNLIRGLREHAEY